MKRIKHLFAITAAMFLGLLLFVLPLASPMSAATEIPWSKYAGNPVLTEGGDPGDWDFGGVGAASVILDAGTFKMWYTGLHFGPWPEIGYATSGNGKAWTKDVANPVFAKGLPGTWDDEGVGSPCVIWDADDSLYKMWYTGTPDSSTSAVPAIGYAYSDDGINWTKDTAHNPVLEGTASEWDENGVLSPSVIKEASDLYKMWYTGRADDGGIGSLQIGYAESTDGKTWTDAQLVLPKGDSGAWDERGVGVGSVIYLSGTYHMWYTGYTGVGEAEIELAIGHATSNDGTTWADADRIQELTKEGAGWEENGVGAPWVLYNDGTYRLWYSGLELDGDYTPRLGYAEYKVPSGGGGGGGGGGGRDLMPPIMSDVSVSSITRTGAEISWLTHEKSDSQVEYRASAPKLTPLDEAMVRVHVVQLTDLAPGTTYYYKTMSTDSADNLAVSEEQTFTTLGEPAALAVQLLDITPTEVDIGEEVTISVIVYNSGDFSGSYEVTLEVDNVAVATRAVTVAGGTGEKVTFTTSRDAAGKCSVSVGGLSGSFTVKEALPPPPPPPVTPPPVTPPTPAVNWWFVGGIIAAVTATAMVLVWQIVIRRRA